MYFDSVSGEPVSKRILTSIVFVAAICGVHLLLILARRVYECLLGKPQGLKNDNPDIFKLAARCGIIADFGFYCALLAAHGEELDFRLKGKSAPEHGRRPRGEPRATSDGGK